MSFIGVISEKKCKINVENILLQNIDSKTHTIININRETIENIKNVKFDILLLIGSITKDIEMYKKIMLNSKFLIINADIEKNLEMIKDLDVSIITYGFNSKCSITTSSIDSPNMLFSLQRGIKSINGKEITPQEIKVDINKNIKEMHIIMGIMAVLVILRRKRIFDKFIKSNILCRQIRFFDV